MNGKKLLLPVVLLVLCLGVATIAYPALQKSQRKEQLQTQTPAQEPVTENQTPPETVTAPDFIVLDAQGKEVHLSDFKGKPVVINFWASWCGYCDLEMPDFQKVYDTQKEDVVFMMININDGKRETQETATAYLKEKNITLPVYFANGGDILENYDANTLPTTYIIDKDGNFYGYAKGAVDSETLETALAQVK